MGKKGSWFSAIKRVFTHSSKDKPTTGSSDKKSSKEKKKGKGILRHGETKSFIPLFREPSSIEKILGEADQLFIRPTTPFDQPKPTSPRGIIASPQTGSRRISASSPKAIIVSPRVSPPRVALPSPRAASPKAFSPRAQSPKVAPPPRAFTTGASSSKTTNGSKAPPSRKEINHVQRPEPTLRNQHHSATMIQAAFRGYLARRSFRALRGLVRLQGVVRGQNVKRQTMNAMKQMQLLVRVQTQIQSRRIQMLENQALQHQAYRNDKEVESTLSKWTQLTEGGQGDDWDDSLLTKEEVEARMGKKIEAIIKRERAMAYAYSHQLWKSNPKSSQNHMDIRANGFPWWWNWLERQLPPTTTSQTPTPSKNFALTPPRPVSEYKPSPRPHPTNYNKANTNNFTFQNQESLTPRSSRSAFPSGSKQFHTPTRTPPPASSRTKPRASLARSAYDVPLKDDDSLMSCPPFSVPNYMVPTVSAKAKVRANSNPKERLVPGTPSNDSKRRFSFPLTPNIASFKWNKGSNSKDSASHQKVLEKHQSSHSIGELSMDSTVSMPAVVGRKPFNRFV